MRVLTRNEANISAALAGCEDVDLDQIEVVTGNLKAKADVEKAVEGVSGIIIARYDLAFCYLQISWPL